MEEEIMGQDAIDLLKGMSKLFRIAAEALNENRAYRQKFGKFKSPETAPHPEGLKEKPINPFDDLDE